MGALWGRACGVMWWEYSDIGEALLLYDAIWGPLEKCGKSFVSSGARLSCGEGVVSEWPVGWC